MTTRALVLIEPGAHRPGGHRHRTLTALAQAHDNTAVVAPYGITAETASALAAARARVATRPYGAMATALLAAGTIAASLAATGRRAFAARRWQTAVRRVPHQVTLLARCLTEAACVRTAHHLAGDPATVVLLSASEALHGLVGLLGGPHTRFVHELVTTEDVPLRALGVLASPGERHVRVLTPTGAVHEELTARFPHLPVRVRPFAVADPGDRLTDAERQQARDAFGIPAGETAVCLVGGWWPDKDLDVIDAALTRLDVTLHLLITGTPLDQQMLDRWRALPRLRLHTVAGPATEAQIRTVYAAADATVVARRPGVAKESGLVTDAVRFGVPLIISDHDPALTTRLTGHDWAWQFPAGDAAGLATVLDDLTQAPPPRPSPQAAALLAVPTAADQIAFLTRTKPKESRRWPSRLY